MTAPPEDEATPRAAPLLPWQHGAARASFARRASLPHALLLHGPRGIGKGTLALALAGSLLCESPREGGEACGACASCLYAAAGQHPDLRIVEPVDLDDEGVRKPRADIGVDSIRELIAFTQITSHRRRAKVALVVPAEAMNVSAANALLKTLEEPPAGTYLILVSHQPGRLAATVRSRCAPLAAPRPSAGQARAWLAEQDVAEPDRVLAQAAGAPLAALALADPALQAERAHWLDALARPSTLSALALSARIDSGGREERKERLAWAVDWLLAWTADLARVSAGGAALFNLDYAPAIAGLGAKLARISLFRYHRRLLQRRALLAHPLAPRLVAEAMLLEYRQLFH